MFTRTQLLLPAAVAAAVVIGACGGAAAPAHTGTATKHKTTMQSSAAVRLATVAINNNGKQTREKLLVTANDRPIYLLTGDRSSHPLCTSVGCLGSWPAVTSSAKHPQLGAGVHGKLTVWTHKGMHQLVLAGHPLYTFADDTSAAVANGNGLKSFGGIWWVMNARGAAVKVTGGGSSNSSASYEEPSNSGSGW